MLQATQPGKQAICPVQSMHRPYVLYISFQLYHTFKITPTWVPKLTEDRVLQNYVFGKHLFVFMKSLLQWRCDVSVGPNKEIWADTLAHLLLLTALCQSLCAKPLLSRVFVFGYLPASHNTVCLSVSYQLQMHSQKCLSVSLISGDSYGEVVSV